MWNEKKMLITMTIKAYRMGQKRCARRFGRMVRKRCENLRLAPRG